MDKVTDQNDSKRRALMAAFDDAVAEDGFAPTGYRIIGELDRGGMAAVYHAKQLNPERDVALKVMLPKFGGEREMRARFQTEARAMASLEHPAIMPIYEVGESDRLPFFSMKLAEGGSLAQRLKSSRPEVRELVDWMIEISGAVHHGHQRGVLHRDLKPGNFLFDSRGQVYVSDFGVAKMLQSEDGGLTRTEAFVGTPNYMPPELAGGVSIEASVAGDLYSLGAVFYECLTEQRPHVNHTNVATLLRAIVDDEIPSPRSVNAKVPVDLDVICRKALEKDPRARYSSVAAFSEDLVRWKEGRAILARPVGLGGILLRWIKRHPLPAALIMAIVLVTVGSAIYIGGQNYQLKDSLSRREGLLYEQYLKKARFERLIGEPGFRERAFSDLSLSAELRNSAEIRNQVVALLARIDVRVQPLEGEDETPEFLSSAVVNDFKISVDGKRLISGHADGKSKLWEVATGELIREWVPAYGQVVQAEFAGDQVLVVGAGDEGGEGLEVRVKLFGGEGFKTMKDLVLPKNESFLFFSVSPDGRIAAMNGQRGLFLLEIESGEVLWRSDMGAAGFEPAWSPDGRTIAAALGHENRIFLFDVANHGNPVSFRTSRLPSQLVFHPEGRLLAAVRSDATISLIDVFEGREVFELPVSQAGHLRFSEGGERFWIGDGGVDAWEIKPTLGYAEWQRLSVVHKNTSIFDFQMSPDDRHLLTVTGAGLGLWSSEERRQIGFYDSENQRVDVESSAWWLSNDEILLQVPGGLEVIRRHEGGELTFARAAKRVPGSRVIEVDGNGDWQVELLDEDGVKTRVVWPRGRVEDEFVPKSVGVAKADSGFSMAEVSIENGKEIRVEGRYDLVLTPADPIEIFKVRLTRDQRMLRAISEGGRVLEWDLKVLSEELRRRGF